MSELKADQPTDEMAAIVEAAELPRALMGGTKAMREAGTKYLPRWPLEEEKVWEARRDSTFLFNGYKQAHGSLVGKVFTREIQLGADAPSQFTEWQENIDLAGNHLHVFAEAAFADSLHPGYGVLLCDAQPRRGGRGRVEDDKRLNARPYLTYVPAERVLSRQYERLNGVLTLTMLRLLEPTTEPVAGSYDSAKVQRVRIFRLIEDEVAPGAEFEGDPPRHAEFELLEERESTGEGGQKVKKWEPVDSGPLLAYSGEPLREITAAEIRYGEERPWLDELAWKNLEHFQSSSDQRSMLHFVRVAAFVAKGITDPENFRAEAFGNGSVFHVPSEGDFGFLEYGGSGPSMGERDLQRIEEQLTVLGLEPLLERPGSETATARRIDETRANSRLIAAERRFADALERAMGFMATFAGLPSGGSINVNEDVGLSLSSVEWARLLLDLRKERGIKLKTLLDELKRRGGLSNDVDVAAEILGLEAESMQAGPVGTARAFTRRVMELTAQGIEMEEAMDQAEMMEVS